MPEEATKVYSVNEVAKILKMDIETVYRLIYSGKLKAVKIGGLWRIPRAALDEVMAGKDLK